MKIFTQLAILLSMVSFLVSGDYFAEQKSIALSGDCQKLTDLKKKLFNASSIPDLTNDQVTHLRIIVKIERDRLNCEKVLVRRRRQVRACNSAAIGDGWCDTECNTKDKFWDGGDCCPHTCLAYQRIYMCGAGGYKCLGDKKFPVYFTEKTQLCYKWFADGAARQCGGGVSNHLCAPVNQMTLAYLDDTDGHPGGCQMSWGLETTAVQLPDWFKKIAICYRWFAERDPGQCGGPGVPNEMCAPLGSYTQFYRDDTDGRPGGCRMSWKISLPSDAEYWAEDISICFMWEANEDAGQCGGGVDRKLCAVAGSWTVYYKDESDQRGGGCKMQWGLVLPFNN